LKTILFIADGMADRPVKELKWKTPLEAANKPSLNKIAENGICGIIDIISPGVPPGSDTASLALLGYDALKVYTGRGAIEAIGSGLEILPGDVAFRCNFATITKDSVVLDRRADRIASEEATELTKSLQKIKLQKPLQIIFKNFIQHRAVLILRGSKFSTAVSNSDPERTSEKVLEVKPLNETAEAKLTAKIINELTAKFRKVLENHPVNKERIKRKLPPANIILCRSAGTVPNIRPLPEIYGVKTSCIAVASPIRGVCKIAGIKLVDVKKATGTPQTNFIAKANATLQALKSNDLVISHLKATDIASHDGNANHKIELIEKIDQTLGYIMKNINLNSTYLVVTADHTTSSTTRNHEGDPVPVAITGPHVRRDNVKEFDENSCSQGGLNRIKGMDLMPILMNLIGKTKKFGA
jgi:2,3-bisphosphoglycerate-independent phosphoglycerate mutase